MVGNIRTQIGTDYLSVICQVYFYELDLLVPAFLFSYLPSAASEIAESIGVESCDMKCLNHVEDNVTIMFHKTIMFMKI